MRNRKQILTPEFVGGLNLIEVEFHDKKEVINAWKNLFRYFCEISGQTELTEQRHQRVAEEMESFTAILLGTIATSLNVKIDNLDIYKGDYSPILWGEIDSEQTNLRRFFLEVLNGNRAFPVNITNFPGNSNEVDTEKK